jgi:cystathionine beta-lyase family protein involved in aluminum resistance
MNYDTPSITPTTRYKKETYELYSQFYEKEDSEEMVKELKEEGHKVIIRKNRKVDNCFGLYVRWNETDPFT